MRSSMVRGCVAALAVALAVAGCKKDAPPAPAPAAQAKAEAAKGEAPKAGEPAKGEPAKAEAPTGEAPKAEAAKGEAPKAGEPAAGEAPKGDVKASSAPIALPAGVAAYAGIRSLDDFTSVSTSVVDKVQPVPGLGLLFSAGLAKTLGVSAGDWLDTSKPIRVAIANPKESRKPGVLVLPLRSREAFEKALPAEREAGADGAAFKYKAGENDAWIAFAGDNAVFARDPKTLAALKELVEGPLLAWAPADPAELHVSGANLTAMFAQELQMARARITEKVSGKAEGLPFPEAAEGLQKAIAWVFDSIDAIETAQISVRVDGDHVMVPLTLHAKKGSALETTFGAVQGRGITLLDYVPATTYFAMGMAFDPKSCGSWTDAGIALLAKGANLPEAEQARLRELLSGAAAVQTGESALAFSKEGTLAMGVLYVGGTRDGAKLREASLGAAAILWDLAVKAIVAKEGAPPAPIDLSTFPKAIETLAPVVAPFGVTLALGKVDHANGPVDTLTLKLDYDNMPFAKEDPQAVEVMKSAVGDTIVFALGFGKDAWAFAVGPETATRVGDIVDGKKTGSPAVRTAVSHAVPGATFVTYLSLVDALKAFVALPDFEGKREIIASMPSSGGSAVSIGSASGNGLQAILDVSLGNVQQMLKLEQARQEVRPEPPGTP